jgi:hypothetical protein
MVFKGQVPIRSKVIIGNTVLEQVNMFTCLECKISCKMEKGCNFKIKVWEILVILKNILKPN